MCKFYQGAEDKHLETQLKKLFSAVHREKPESSRSVSHPMKTGLQLLTNGRNLRRRILWH